MIECDHRPTSLRQYLHHHINSIHEIFEISHLLVLVVRGTARHIIGVKIVKYLHAEDNVNIEEKCKKIHEFKDNRHDLKNNGKDILNLMPNLKIDPPHKIAMRNQSQQAGQSENSAHSDNTISIWVIGYEKEDDTNSDQKSINHIPSIHEKYLWPICDNSDDKLNKKYPNEDGVKIFKNYAVLEHEEDGIDERKNDKDRNNKLENPMLYYILKVKLSIHKFTKLYP